ncbi:v-type c subunit family protein [Phlyctema vagabunda]|uniref:V-type c subunit family protein n=1 Tax=Phlyctema vagabunda TaxID=108571 RepID=A0ABR4PN10_9HELO
MLLRAAACRPSPISFSGFRLRHVTASLPSSTWKRFEHTEPEASDAASETKAVRRHGSRTLVRRYYASPDPWAPEPAVDRTTSSGDATINESILDKTTLGPTMKKYMSQSRSKVYREATQDDGQDPFRETYGMLEKRIASKHFPSRQFTVAALGSTMMTKDHVLLQAASTYEHLNYETQRAFVILVTPAYASWITDDKFMVRFIKKLLRKRQNQKSIEVSVLSAVVDGLAPNLHNMAIGAVPVPEEGISVLDGYQHRILPGLWDSPEETDRTTNDTQSCITFDWHKIDGPTVEFTDLESSVRAFHALTTDERYKEIEVKYHKPWNECFTSAVSLRRSMDVAVVSDKKMRAVKIFGLPPRIVSHREITHIVRGGTIEKIDYEPGRSHCLVTFVEARRALEFLRWTRKNPVEFSTSDSERLTARLEPAPPFTQFIRSSLEMTARRGLQITRMPTSWSGEQLLNELSRFGTICNETIPTKAVSGGLNHLNVTMPLANTLFINGQHSTMHATQWEVKKRSSTKLKAVEKKHQVIRVDISATNNLPRIHESFPLIPLTEPRRIASGMGNIVRELDFGDQGCGPASRELEDNVDDYLEATRDNQAQDTQREPLRIWAIVIPEHLSEEFLRVTPSRPNFKRPRRLIETYLQEDSQKLLDYWMSRGATLCRVLSGGGGWGAKQGLLSLDPQTNYADVAEARFDYSLDIEGEEQDSALGKVALPGSIIQFLIPWQQRGSNIPNLLPQFLFSDTTVFGTVPSTIDSVPTDVKTDDAPETPQPKKRSRYYHGLFGAVSESGLFLNYKAKVSEVSDTADGDLLPSRIQTKLDVPYTYIAQESITNFGRITKRNKSALTALESQSFSSKGQPLPQRDPQIEIETSTPQHEKPLVRQVLSKIIKAKQNPAEGENRPSPYNVSWFTS